MAPEEILKQSIFSKKCVRSTYNGDSVKLAPHALFCHHDQYFLYAITVDRNGNSPKQTKLGVFKVSGLKGLAPDEQAFQPLRKFNPKDEKIRGTVIAIVVA